MRPRDVTLIAGQDNELEVEVTAAVVRSIEVAFPPPDRWQRGNLVLRDARGEIVSELVGMQSDSVGMRPVSWRSSQPLGAFTLEASADDGPAKTWPVDFSDPATAEGTLRFSLRRAGAKSGLFCATAGVRQEAMRTNKEDVRQVSWPAALREA